MPFFGLGKPNIEKLEEKRDVKRLCKALSYKDEMVGRDAAFDLGKIGDKRAVEPLIVALKDPKDNVCRNAAESLGKIGDPRAVEPLITLAQDEGYARAPLKRFDDPRARLPLVCAKCNLMMRLPKIGTIVARTGTPEALEAGPLECPSCNLFFCSGCAKRGRVLICPKCGGDLLDMATETPPTYTTKATYMSDEAMLDVLRRLCNAHLAYCYELNEQYREPISAQIASIESLATEIGWELHRRGGFQEMSRMFQRVKNNQPRRCLPIGLDTLWNGIGDWRAHLLL